MAVPLYQAHRWILPGGTRARGGLSPGPARAGARPRSPSPRSCSALASAPLSLASRTGSLMVMMFQHVDPPATAPGAPPAAAAPRRPQAQQARQLTLPPQPSAVPHARHAIQQTLRSWKLDALTDTTVLLASELLTNAVQATCAASATGGEHLALTLQRTGPGVLVEVWDPNPGPAIPQNPGPTDECGRGLLLVEALASTWGQCIAGSGKTVWCEITLPAAHGQALARQPRPGSDDPGPGRAGLPIS